MSKHRRDQYCQAFSLRVPRFHSPGYESEEGNRRAPLIYSQNRLVYG